MFSRLGAIKVGPARCLREVRENVASMFGRANMAVIGADMYEKDMDQEIKLQSST